MRQLCSCWCILLFFFCLFHIFTQTCAVLDPKKENVKEVHLSVQICDGKSGDYSEKHKTEIMSKFLRMFPLANCSEKVKIVPRIQLDHSCEPGDALQRKLQVQDVNSREIESPTYDVDNYSSNNFIEFNKNNVCLILNQGETGNANTTISPDHVCVQPQFNKNGLVENLEILSCHKPLFVNCSNDRPCVRKCCAADEGWDFTNSTCRKLWNGTDPWTWSPLFYEMTEDRDCVVKLGGTVLGMQYEVGTPENCSTIQEWNVIPTRNIPGEYALGRYRMLTDGSVLMNYENGSWIPLSRGSYCVDEIQIVRHHKKNKTKKAKVLLVCKFEYKVKGPKKPIPSLYATMLFTSSAILILIVIVYILIWDRHSIYEWTMFCEVFSMIGMIVFVAVAHTVARDPSDGYFGSRKCIGLGMLSHYFFLATFFWLFVINFEIWWNFRALSLKNKKSRKWLRLTLYQMVGWGCPAVIVFIGWLLDRIYGLQNDKIDCTSLILPNYGQLNCYISKRAQGPYLYYPIGVLLGCNLILYLMTAFKLGQYQKNSQQLNRNKSNGHSKPFVVFVRLFIVMGVSWIAEVVAWAVQPVGVPGQPPIYWIVFDYVTLAQAIAIFIIFICRAEILHRLTDKYPQLRFIFEPLCRLLGCPVPVAHPLGQNSGTPSGSVHRRRLASAPLSSPSARDRIRSSSLSQTSSSEDMDNNDLKLCKLNNFHTPSNT